MNFIIIAVTLLVLGFLMFTKKLQNSSDWQSTVTPLASIMGGFLVSAPLLSGVAGNYAVFYMAGLILAYCVGESTDTILDILSL